MIEVREIVVRCARHSFRYKLLANIGQQGERMWKHTSWAKLCCTVIYPDSDQVRNSYTWD